MKTNLRKLVLASIFIAFAIIFTRLFSFLIGDYLRIGLGDLPILLAGIILGPWWGLAVGAISDLLGFAIAPLGGFLPGITLSAALWGFIPGAVVSLMYKKRNFMTILISCIACGILLDIGLTPLVLSVFYGRAVYFAKLPIQALNAVIMMVVNTLLTIAIVRALVKGKIIEPTIKRETYDI